MRILQVNVVNNPASSTGAIILDIHRFLLESGHESLILYGLGNRSYDSKQIRISNRFEVKINSIQAKVTGYPYSGCYLSTNRLIKRIREFQPDIVHLHVINNYFVNHYTLLTYLKTNAINTVVTLHAEYMYTGKCGHAYECLKWKFGCGDCPQKRNEPSTWLFDRTSIEWKRKYNLYQDYHNLVFVCVSKWINDRALQSPLLKDKLFYIVHNGIDTEYVFNPNNGKDLDIIRKKYNIPDTSKILLHVTARYSNVSKGGKYIILLAERFLNDDIKIIIIGFEGNSDLLPSNIIPINYIIDREQLSLFYQISDLTVLTSRKETFSMICAESLSCGTPVVGFKAGAPEQISLKDYSEFVDYGNIDQLIITIRNWINRKKSVKVQIREQAKDYYSKLKMCNMYYNIYESFTNQSID